MSLLCKQVLIRVCVCALARIGTRLGSHNIADAVCSFLCVCLSVSFRDTTAMDFFARPSAAAKPVEPKNSNFVCRACETDLPVVKGKCGHYNVGRCATCCDKCSPAKGYVGTCGGANCSEQWPPMVSGVVDCGADSNSAESCRGKALAAAAAKAAAAAAKAAAVAAPKEGKKGVPELETKKPAAAPEGKEVVERIPSGYVTKEIAHVALYNTCLDELGEVERILINGVGERQLVPYAVGLVQKLLMVGRHPFHLREPVFECNQNHQTTAQAVQTEGARRARGRTVDQFRANPKNWINFQAQHPTIQARFLDSDVLSPDNTVWSPIRVVDWQVQVPRETTVRDFGTALRLNGHYDIDVPTEIFDAMLPRTGLWREKKDSPRVVLLPVEFRVIASVNNTNIDFCPRILANGSNAEFTTHQRVNAPWVDVCGGKDEVKRECAPFIMNADTTQRDIEFPLFSREVCDCIKDSLKWHALYSANEIDEQIRALVQANLKVAESGSFTTSIIEAFISSHFSADYFAGNAEQQVAEKNGLTEERQKDYKWIESSFRPDDNSYRLTGQRIYDAFEAELKKGNPDRYTVDTKKGLTVRLVPCNVDSATQAATLFSGGSDGRIQLSLMIRMGYQVLVPNVKA